MMITTMDKNIIEDVKVGRGEVSVSYSQFAFDTLIFCPSKRRVLTNIKKDVGLFPSIFRA